MRRLLLTMSAVTLVSAMTLGSHRAEAIVLATPTSIQAALKATNPAVTIGCVTRRVCSRGACAMRRVCV